MASGCPDTDAWPVRYWNVAVLELLSQLKTVHQDVRCSRPGALLRPVLLQELWSVQRAGGKPDGGAEGCRAGGDGQGEVGGGSHQADVAGADVYGARIVEMILGDAEMREEWRESVRVMARRIKQMRKVLLIYLFVILFLSEKFTFLLYQIEIGPVFSENN